MLIEKSAFCARRMLAPSLSVSLIMLSFRRCSSSSEIEWLRSIVVRLLNRNSSLNSLCLKATKIKNLAPWIILTSSPVIQSDRKLLIALTKLSAKLKKSVGTTELGERTCPCRFSSTSPNVLIKISSLSSPWGNALWRFYSNDRLALLPTLGLSFLYSSPGVLSSCECQPDPSFPGQK